MSTASGQEAAPPEIEIIEPGFDIDEHERTLRHLDRLERLLDRNFSIAGFRFGWDAVIGLVPFVGDTLTTGLSGYIIWKAHQLGAPNHVKARMIANTGVDYVLGLVPLIGDLGDAAFKANTRNVRLLKQHLEARYREGVVRRPR